MTATKGPGIKVPPPVILFSFLGIAWLLGRTIPLPSMSSRPTTILGLACVGAFICEEVGCFWLFRRSRVNPIAFGPSGSLVTSGPYRFSRNPMYVGGIVLYAGLAMLLDLLWALLLAPAFVMVLQLYVVRREEASLEREFGEAYREYRSHVPRWL